MSASNRKLKQQLTRALAAPPQSRTAAVPETLLHRCRAAYHPCPRGSWKNLLYWQLRLLGWKAAGLEAFAALALYSVGRALGLWEAAWSLRHALFGLTALAMCTALLGLPFSASAGRGGGAAGGAGNQRVRSRAAQTWPAGVSAGGAVPAGEQRAVAAFAPRAPGTAGAGRRAAVCWAIVPAAPDRGRRRIAAAARRSAAGGRCAGGVSGRTVRPPCRPAGIRGRNVKGAFV